MKKFSASTPSSLSPSSIAASVRFFDKRTAASIMLLLFSLPLVPAQKPDINQHIGNIEIAERARQGTHDQVYLIAEGDTIKTIATRFSNDPNFASELLALNQLKESELRPGRPLIIPGPEREFAIKALNRAKTAMKQAVAANAAKYALNEFKEAVDIYDDGARARNGGSYIRAKLLADLAYERFARARNSADQGAIKIRPASLELLHGKTFVSTNNGLSYKSATNNTQLTNGHIVRTSDSGTARIVFDDESSLQLKPGSTLTFALYRQDQRTGKSKRLVKLGRGEVLAKTTPLEVEDSSFDLLNGTVRISLNGSTVLARNTPGQGVIQCTYDGQSEISYQGKQFVQGIGTGSMYSDKRGLEGPFPLNESVDILEPSTSSLVTAKQQYTVRWRESANHGDVEYLLEIANDELFAHIVEQVTTKDTSHSTRPLSAGTYYLRVSLINPLGLIGFASETIKLDIKPNLELQLGYDLNQRTLNGVHYVQPNAQVLAVPALKDNSVQYIMYQIDKSTFFTSDEGVTLADSGTFTVRARGHGIEKNHGDVAELKLTIDNQAPELRIHVGELTEIPGYGTVRTLAFIADDNTGLKNIEYNLNGGNYRTYTKPLKLPVSKSFRIQARAMDYFNNTAETVMSLERIKINPRKPAVKETGLLNRIFEKKPKD